MDQINIQNLYVHQNNTALIKDIIPVALAVNELLTPPEPTPPTPATTPLIATVDMVIPQYTSAVVNEYFWIPINQSLTIEQGSIFRIL